jgi:hypothetical protein
VQRQGIDRIACAWIEVAHHRVVAGDDAIGMARKTLDSFPALSPSPLWNTTRSLNT